MKIPTLKSTSGKIKINKNNVNKILLAKIIFKKLTHHNIESVVQFQLNKKTLLTTVFLSMAKCLIKNEDYDLNGTIYEIVTNNKMIT